MAWIKIKWGTWLSCLWENLAYGQLHLPWLLKLWKLNTIFYQNREVLGFQKWNSWAITRKTSRITISKQKRQKLLKSWIISMPPVSGFWGLNFSPLAPIQNKPFIQLVVNPFLYPLDINVWFSGDISPREKLDASHSWGSKSWAKTTSLTNCFQHQIEVTPMKLSWRWSEPSAFLSHFLTV